MNIHLRCRNGACDYFGIIDPQETWWWWFELHRWPEALDAGALDCFRCTQCGAKAGHARPTENAVTVVDFFPAAERGWKMLQRRLRG